MPTFASLPTQGASLGVWCAQWIDWFTISHNSDGSLKVSGGAGTAWAIPFIDSNGLLAQDAANFGHDPTRHFTGVGVSAQNTTASLHTNGGVRYDSFGLGIPEFDASGNISSSALTWTSFTPTLAASGGGTFGSVATTGLYVLIGKLLIVQYAVNITSIGSASGVVELSLPNSYVAGPIGGQGVGREQSVTGYELQFFVNGSSNTVVVYTYNNAVTVVNGWNMQGVVITEIA